MQSRERIVLLDGGVNFRDLGGYLGAGGRHTRWQHLFRSGSTHRLTPAARKYLEGLGIRVAVDLRSNREQQEHPHGLSNHPECTYLAFDHDQPGGDIARMLKSPQLEAAHLREGMLGMYRELPYEFKGVYAALFRYVAFGPLPLVFNCAAGKDRTGVAAALLLQALGVAWADIEADYLLSARFVPDITQSLLASRLGSRLARFDPEVVAPIFQVDPAYLSAMRQAVFERSGSFEEYFRGELQLTGDLIDGLRNRLLQ